MAETFPTQSQIVIIGGGIVGCSTAYHLAKLGWTDVVLLERKELGSGTTWAAAGLIAQLRQNQEMSNLAKYATRLYAELEAETSVATGWVRTGAIGVCQTDDRRREWLRGAARARAYGIEMHEISLKEAEDLCPLMSSRGLVSAFYLPDDGQTDPIGTTQSLAKGARMRGVQIFENTRVLDIHLNRGRISGVSTDRGEIACEIVVNCAGMWSRGIGKWVNASLPLHAAEHMHAVTTPIKGLKKAFPCVRDFDGYTYFKEESGGILLGGFEPKAKAWGMKGIPEQFKFTELQEDWDQFELFMACGFERFPCLEEAEIRHLQVVPESFTPDNAFMVGEVPGIKNLFTACGMNSVGIASAAGAGRAVSQWIDRGYPEEQLWPLDVRRFFPWQQNARYLAERVTESVGMLYEHHYPNRQRTTARPVICSPIHDRLREGGAVFSQIAGWERADWFAPPGVEPIHAYSWGRPNWFACQREEHLAMRDNVGLYDLSSMGKFLIEGVDAGAVLQHLCANNLDVAVGQVVYTPLLNERGGYESDFTITRIGENQYFLVTAVGTTVRDFDYLKRHIPDDARVHITDVTHGYSLLALMGPKSRDLLVTLTDADLSNTAFPYATAQQIDVGYARAWALRMSYVGELGWELYLPTGFTLPVFDRIMAAGEKMALKLVGMQAVNSLRLETGYRHWESDITPDDTPYEAGLGFAVKLDKGDFIGRDALIRQKETGMTQRLVMFTLDDPHPLLFGNEPIFRNGAHVGELSSGAYGFKIGTAVGMGYVKNPAGVSNEWIKAGSYQIEVEGERYVATLHLRSPYDPHNERTRM
ncbi:MAG: FAD-dependent oxidoreductase [bacterium]